MKHIMLEVHRARRGDGVRCFVATGFAASWSVLVFSARGLDRTLVPVSNSTTTAIAVALLHI